MTFSFQKIDLEVARQIVAWEYPSPYHAYNLHGSALAVARFIDGPYFAVFSQEELMGFFCYGEASQLASHRKHGLYQVKGYLDVGLGMNPALCGRGLGASFLRSGLTFARQRDWQGGFRLTVASNNVRAYKVYNRLGFTEIGRIAWDTKLTADFVVMTLDTFEQDPLTCLVD